MKLIQKNISFIICMILFVILSGVCQADTPQPVVAIDEFHWNSLLLSPPTATNRITMLRDELIAGGYAVHEINQLITSEVLADCDVLIVSTPSKDYDDAELAAIKSFAGAGGGVFFGANYGPALWSSSCQTFANTLGFTLDNNSATDNTHNAGYPSWITFDTSCIGTHPVTAGVSSLQCFATTTLVPSSSVTALASTDADAIPALRPAIQAADYESGRVIMSGSSLYLSDPVSSSNRMGLLAADNRRFAYNTVTWLAGAAGRPLVTVSLSKSFGCSADTIDITGTVCDAELSNYILEYKPASGQDEWIQIGVIHTSSVVKGELGSWPLTGIDPGDYILRVRATNAAGGSYSVSNPVYVARDLDKITDIRDIPDGTYVRLTDKEVVAGSDDLIGRIYIEEENRSSGMVVLTSKTAPRGSYVTVTGPVSTSDGMRVITAANVEINGLAADSIRPLGVQNSQAGVAVAGLGTPGMLVKTWGKVTSVDTDGFSMTDGSPDGVKILTGYLQTTISIPDVGSTVAVTGIGSVCNGVPAIVVRQSDDVQTIMLPQL